jgi:hypothetical protein
MTFKTFLGHKRVDFPTKSVDDTSQFLFEKV